MDWPHGKMTICKYFLGRRPGVEVSQLLLNGISLNCEAKKWTDEGDYLWSRCRYFLGERFQVRKMMHFLMKCCVLKGNAA
jgi:hypothetical protein